MHRRWEFRNPHGVTALFSNGDCIDMCEVDEDFDQSELFSTAMSWRKTKFGLDGEVAARGIDSFYILAIILYKRLWPHG
jgi:hypothetical protein